MLQRVVKSLSTIDALTLFLTGLVCVIIPPYWYYYGVHNFLWLSDLGLFATVVALWSHSILLMSTAAVGVFVLELVWCVDFFVDLIFNINIIDLSDYMFNPAYPLFLRSLSFFHVITPVIWLLYLQKHGYNSRALLGATVSYWIVLFMTYMLTPVSENINWVFLPTVYQWALVSQFVWVGFLCLFFPLAIFFPTHLLFSFLFKRSG